MQKNACSRLLGFRMILQSSILLCSNFDDDFDELFEQGKLLWIVLLSTHPAVQNAPQDG
jgi:hypothetical protein